MIRYGLMAAWVALTASQAGAAPIYLECSFTTKAGTTEVRITANEDTASVSAFLPSTGNVQSYKAAFTPDNVAFEDRLLAYTLSRRDLTLRREIKMIRAVDIGTCKIQKPPKDRAF